MEYLFGIIILLGVLVFFHEFGHFIVSKFFGVKVEVFSLGFGPKIVKKKMGETQYCISLIPLGGYVKLYGEDPTAPIKGADAKRSFSNQPVWNRIAIAAAGPIFNFILADIFFQSSEDDVESYILFFNRKTGIPLVITKGFHPAPHREEGNFFSYLSFSAKGQVQVTIGNINKYLKFIN